MSMIKWLFFATIFLLPAYVVRFSIFGVATNVPESLAMFSILSATVTLFKGGILTDIKILRILTDIKILRILKILKRFWPEFAGVTLLLIGLAIATALSPDPRAGLGVIKSWFIMPFAFALLARLTHGTWNMKHGTKIIGQALAASGAVVSLIALGYALLGQFTFDGRLRAFYDSPNQLGMWLAITLVATFLEIRKLREIKKFIFYYKFLLISVVSQFLTLLLTHSRGGLLAAAVGILAVILLPKLQRLNKAALVKCSVLCVMCYVALSALLTTQLQHFIPPDSRSSLASRAQIWRAGWDIGRDNWFTGIGPRQFQQKYLEYQPKYPPYLEWAAPEPHNLLLATWLNTGLLGLVGLLLFIVRRPLHPLVVVLLVLGLFDTPIWASDTSYIFWLAATACPLGLAARLLPG